MKKKQLLVTIFIVIIISGLVYYLFFKNNPAEESKEIKELKQLPKTDQVIEYKKAWYDSVYCSYNCPLKLQKINNKTQLFPNEDCIKNCSIEFKKYAGVVNFTKQELTSDNLIQDIETSVEKCRQSTYDANIKAFNSSALFPCVAKDIEGLKQKYNYLN